MVSQIILSVFLLFALSRVVMQVRSTKLSVSQFVFWGGVFILAIVGVMDPELTTHIARILGIGRGADVVLYISITLLFYLIFRLSIALEETKREISELVRKIALRDTKSPIRKKNT